MIPSPLQSVLSKTWESSLISPWVPTCAVIKQVMSNLFHNRFDWFCPLISIFIIDLSYPHCHHLPLGQRNNLWLVSLHSVFTSIYFPHNSLFKNFKRSHLTIPVLKTFEWIPIALMVMSKYFNVAYIVLCNPASSSGLSFCCSISSHSGCLLAIWTYQVPSCLGLCISCHLCFRCPLHLSLFCLCLFIV